MCVGGLPGGWPGVPRRCPSAARGPDTARVSLLSTTRVDRLGRCLSELRAREPLFEGFQEMEERALRLETGFYDQFPPMLEATVQVG